MLRIYIDLIFQNIYANAGRALGDWGDGGAYPNGVLLEVMSQH